jgi:hypothetical protein
MNGGLAVAFAVVGFRLLWLVAWIAWRRRNDSPVPLRSHVAGVLSLLLLFVVAFVVFRSV